MPRTNLGQKALKDTPTERRKTLNRIIKIGMARKDIATQEEVAIRLGMGRSSFSKRMSGIVPWTFDELCRLFHALEFTPEEAAQAMSVRPV